MSTTIYTPQNPSPRNEVRDMSLDQNITCTVDGIKYTDYQIRFYRVSDNVLVHDTTKINLATPLANGQTLTHLLTGGTLTNSATESYKWTIQVWNGAETKTSREFQFFAKTTPVLTFTVPDPITSQSYEFTATLVQAEGDIVNNYTFELYDSQDVLIESSGSITDFNIQHTFEGFTNGDNLKVRLFGTTTGGQTFDSGLVSFTVAYSEPVIELVPNVTVDNDTSLVTVEIPEAIQIIGVDTPSGVTYEEKTIIGLGESGIQEYTFDTVYLDSGQNVFFDVTVPLDFSLEYVWIPDSNDFTGKIIELGNEDYFIYFEDNKFFYTINGVTQHINNPANQLLSHAYIFIMLPTEVKLFMFSADQPIFM